MYFYLIQKQNAITINLERRSLAVASYFTNAWTSSSRFNVKVQRQAISRTFNVNIKSKIIIECKSVACYRLHGGEVLVTTGTSRKWWFYWKIQLNLKHRESETKSGKSKSPNISIVAFCFQPTKYIPMLEKKCFVKQK